MNQKIIKTLVVMILFMITSQTVYSQNEKDKSGGGGAFQFGIRSTVSFFGNDGYIGNGFGGQFRLKINDRINSEWFADYITNNIGHLGKRTDGHIGWSILFYPYLPEKDRIKPYILAGHCFDYTHVQVFSSYYEYNGNTDKRWSAAAQMGIGTHWNISKRADLSLSAQYMIHFGRHIHADIHEEDNETHLHIESETGFNVFEGHLFLTLSMNIKIAELW